MLPQTQEEALEKERQYAASQKDDRVDLVTVTYFRKELTDACLAYLLTRTKTPYRLTVVDNGSKDGTPELLMKLKFMGVIDNLILLDKNYGLEYARNTALRHVNSEYVVFFDNDMLCPEIEPDWLSQELSLIKKYPEYGAIALRPQVIVGVNENEVFSQEGEIVPNKHTGASFLMLKTDIIKKLGWSDYFTNRVSDWTLGDKIKQEGLKWGWARNIRCYHIYRKNWSYPDDVPHFHREISPPSEAYDRQVDFKTLEPYD